MRYLEQHARWKVSKGQLWLTWASLVAQLVKNLPAMRETWVQSLGWEDPLEEGMTTHSSFLAWRMPWTEGPGGLLSKGLQRVGNDWVTFTSLHPFLEFFHWNIVLPAGAWHFTWNSAYCSVLSSKTFSVLFLSLCRKSIRRETSHDVLVLFCERFFYTWRNVPSNFWWNPTRGNLHHPQLTFTLWKFETIRVLPI